MLRPIFFIIHIDNFLNLILINSEIRLALPSFEAPVALEVDFSFHDYKTTFQADRSSYYQSFGIERVSRYKF